MSDLICKKDLNRCPTPGMCSPHGGCQPEKGFESEHLDLGKFMDWVWALKSERDQLKAENEVLRGEIATDDKIIAERDRLLNMFECPEHGQCVPYAMEQVARLQAAARTLERIGYTDNGGEMWKPPLGDAPDFGVMNKGHGHVFPRSDGVRMRCGGPGMCKECSADLFRKERKV